MRSPRTENFRNPFLNTWLLLLILAWSSVEFPHGSACFTLTSFHAPFYILTAWLDEHRNKTKKNNKTLEKNA